MTDLTGLQDMTDLTGLQEVATFCGKCDCGCPQLFIDPAAPQDKRIVITDDFGQRVQMSADQFSSLVEEAKEGKFNALAVA